MLVLIHEKKKAIDEALYKIDSFLFFFYSRIVCTSACFKNIFFIDLIGKCCLKKVKCFWKDELYELIELENKFLYVLFQWVLYWFLKSELNRNRLKQLTRIKVRSFMTISPSFFYTINAVTLVSYHMIIRITSYGRNTPEFLIFTLKTVTGCLWMKELDKRNK